MSSILGSGRLEYEALYRLAVHKENTLNHNKFAQERRNGGRRLRRMVADFGQWVSRLWQPSASSRTATPPISALSRPFTSTRNVQPFRGHTVAAYTSSSYPERCGAVIRRRRTVPKSTLPLVRRRHVGRIKSPEEKPLSEIRGWRVSGDWWYGTYKHRGHCYQGRAEKKREGHYEFFVKNPPQTFQNHVCVTKKSDVWWFLHIYPEKPKNLSQGIYVVEDWLEKSVYSSTH